MQTPGQADRVSYIVLRQPLALDRFMLHDISASDAAGQLILFVNDINTHYSRMCFIHMYRKICLLLICYMYTWI